MRFSPAAVGIQMYQRRCLVLRDDKGVPVIWSGREDAPPYPGRTCGAARHSSSGTGVLPMMASVMFLDCPAYMDKNGSVRCGLPAEVEGRYTMSSTDGLLESVRIRCPRGHWFNGPVDSLLVERAPERPAPAAPAAGSPLRPHGRLAPSPRKPG